MATVPQPIFLIGAARSGTKMLRDLIASHPAVDRVPYDVNFIWRLGNEGLPHDELTPAHVTSSIARNIRRRLYAYNRGAPFLIEKTVSNTLRVPFVDAIFPNAKFIFLFRDGCDVVESAYRQWSAPPDWNYLLEKARTFPLLDSPGYALRYALNLLKKCGLAGRKIATWGPRYEGIDQDVITKDLIEICAIQWSRCVDKAYFSLQRLDPQRVLAIKYEDFVARPKHRLLEIAEFIGIDPRPYCKEDAIHYIRTNNIGKGWNHLSFEQQRQVIHIIQDQLALLGYDIPRPRTDRPLGWKPASNPIGSSFPSIITTRSTG